VRKNKNTSGIIKNKINMPRIKKKENLLRNPYFRICLVISSILLVIAVFTFIILLSYKILFSNNPRFNLKKVSVNSSGYWNGRSRDIMKTLKLKRGKTNIFAVSLKELRNTLKEGEMYTIENVEIYRMLPDTLKFNIFERIPKAILYNKKSNLIIDRNGILINRKYCININKNLPVITGFVLKEPDFSAKSYKNNKIPFGEKLSQLSPALALISLVDTDYPEFNIKLINLYDPNSLIVYMAGPKKRKIIKVLLPFKHSATSLLTVAQLTKETNKLKKKLEELRELYSYLKNRRKEVAEINLMFDEQAILK